MERQSGDHATKESVNAIRDDFEMASAIMKYAIEKDIEHFTLSGLKIPLVLQTWSKGADLPPVDKLVTEVSIFQEHLYDRIAALADNREMLREIWRFNEHSREFRELELQIPDAARHILDLTSELINALFVHDEVAALKVLDNCLRCRFSHMTEIMPKIRETGPERAPYWPSVDAH